MAGVDARELQVMITPALSWRSTVDRAVRPWLSVIVSIWCLGVLAFAWRPLLSWHAVRRLRRVGVSPVPVAVAAMLRQTSERLRLRQTVQILQSTLTRVPIVIGYLRPVILLPVSVIAGVPTSQLEAILAHELAHVRRHDFLVNLLQTLVETLFFYHPAVWWLSHRIRIERENCCDDLAVSVLGNRVEYGRALLAIEELRGTSTALALGVRSGSLLDRVQRLFRRDPAERTVGAVGIVGVGLLALVILAVGVWNSTQADDEGITPGATAKLDGGVEVKLLGVSYQPSENQPWWTPEGASLPGDPLETRWKSGKTRVHDEGEHRELALEITGAEHDVHAWVDFAPGDKLGMWSTIWNFQDDEPTRKRMTLLRAVSAGFPKGEKQRDVLVRLAVAPWQPYQMIDLKREKPKLDGEPEDGSVQLRRVQELTDGTTQVDIAFPAKFELRAQHEVVAQDVDGNEVKLHGTTIADAGARGLIFRCPIDRLAKVGVRFRWYTHEVTFENVSLFPDHKTQPAARVRKLKSPADVVAQIPDAAYTRPTADDQRATATIPAEAWGEPVDGLRVAIVLRSPPIDEHQRLCYDIVAENVSDQDIRFGATLGVDDWHNYCKTKLADADGNPLVQQAGSRLRLPSTLKRLWLKPKERGVISSWATGLLKQDEKEQLPASPKDYRGPWYFSVKPGRYSVSAEVELGPSMFSTDPGSGTRTVISPAKGEWSGKLRTGTAVVRLFEPPAAEEPVQPEIDGSQEKRKLEDVRRAIDLYELSFRQQAVAAAALARIGDVQNVITSPDEKLVAVTSGNQIFFLDATTGKVERQFAAHEKDVSSFSILASGVQGVEEQPDNSTAAVARRCRLESFEEAATGGKRHWRTTIFVPQGSTIYESNLSLTQEELDEMQERGVEFKIFPLRHHVESGLAGIVTEPVWGETVNGLQLGVSGIREQQHFATGTTVRFNLLVRNAGSEPVRIQYFISKTGYWIAPKIVTEAGEQVRFDAMAFRGGHKTYIKTLEPEAMVGIEAPGIIVLGESKTANQYWTRFPNPQPGEYKLDAGFFLTRVDSEDKPLGKYFTLTSGSVNFHIDAPKELEPN